MVDKILSKTIRSLSNERVITGDRPTGKLHIGHYVGSLASRVSMQKCNLQYILIANLQALTDDISRHQLIKDNVFELVKDYISVGIDPKKSTIFLQSDVQELGELTIILLNFVSYSKLSHNPTLKQEIKDRYKDNKVNMGFLCYPISQASDILAFQPTIVPVGSDQNPMIEQCNYIINKVNSLTNKQLFNNVSSVTSHFPRLVGLDGKKKMSKSLNNCIYLSDSDEDIKKKVFSMFTDPNHVKIEDPGKVEGNTVFSYLDIFFKDTNELERLKQKYQKGGLGDTYLKNLLYESLSEFLSPIREKRQCIDQKRIKDILEEGKIRAKHEASKTLSTIKNILNLYV